MYGNHVACRGAYSHGLRCGFLRLPLPERSVPHRHLNYEVYFVEKGSCTAHCMGEEYTAFEGDFLLIGAGVEHNVSSLSEDASLYSFRCSFYPARKEDEGLYLKLIERLRFASALRKKTVLISLLRLIRWELSERRAMFRGVLRGFFARSPRRSCRYSSYATILGLHARREGAKGLS